LLALFLAVPLGASFAGVAALWADRLSLGEQVHSLAYLLVFGASVVTITFLVARRAYSVRSALKRVLLAICASFVLLVVALFLMPSAPR
jgi:hypothetical protein